jgi:hypothetical protein
MKNLTGVTIIFMALVCCVCSYAANDLVLYLSFDEGAGNIAHDSSAFGNDCVLNGNPKWTDGPFGTALELDGASWGEVADDNSLDLTDAMTIETWARIPPGGEGIQSAVEKGSGWVEGEYNLAALYNGGTILQMRDLPADCADTNIGNSIQDGEWHFLAGTWDGAALRLYIDGNLDAEMECAGTILTNDDPLFIGARGGSERFVTGALDEIKVYNYALSQAEIIADMENPVPPSAVKPYSKLAVTLGTLKSD